MLGPASLDVLLVRHAEAVPAVYRITHDGSRWKVTGGHGFGLAKG